MDDKSVLLAKLKSILDDFEKKYELNDLRERVLSLIPAYDTVRELGKSLIQSNRKLSARDRILKYFLTYPRIIINEKEITIIAGISEWARRVRELRVQFGWKIVTGVTIKEMNIEKEIDIDGIDFNSLGPNVYSDGIHLTPCS